MTTLSRVTGKVFGGSAPLDEIGQFGSAKAGTKLNTQDVATIQALPAYSTGWGSAIMTSRNFPPIEEVTGVLKTISYQNCYLLQEGIPEYDINTNYSGTSVVKSISGTTLKFFISLQDDNQGNDLSNSTYWAEATLNGGRNIGEIITSSIPLSDAGLHLLDGAIISGAGAYADFVEYIARIYNSSLNFFCTEAQWQASVSQYGSCGKFVYDSTNNTVRLPKITNILQGTNDVNSLGSLVEAGLPNITGSFFGAGESASNATGVFYKIGAGVQVSNSGDRDNNYGFDASRSNAIYGNSNTVQPQTIKVFYYIVVATSTKTDIEVDIDEIATDLNGKADVDLSNCTQPYITETYQNGTSWYRVYSDDWCEQGGRQSINNYGVTVTYLKPFRDTNYGIVISQAAPGSSHAEYYNAVKVNTKYTTSFVAYCGQSEAPACEWHACGYIS